MENKRLSILILTRMISRNSGGMSSALDMAETFHSLGFDLNIGLTGSSPLLYLLKDRKKFKTKIPLSQIYAVPDGLSQLLNKNRGKSIWEISKEKSKKYNRNFSYEIIGRLFSVLINKCSGFFKKRKFNAVLEKTDIIIVASSLYTGAKEEINKITKAKIVLNHAGSSDSYENWLLSQAHTPLVKDKNVSNYVNYLRQFDKVIFQAEDQALECENKHNSLKNITAVIKPTCDELNVLASKQEPSPYKPNKFIIVNVGSIQPRKGQHYSILAFSRVIKQIPDAELHFVGRRIMGDYWNKLDKIISESALSDKIFFHGHRHDYLRYISHADLVIQTSEAEGVSRILRETMLLKIPIISFAISGTSDILENNKEALLVEPFNIEKLSESIIEMTNKPELRTDLAKNSLTRYYLEHSKARYFNNWIKELQIMCNNEA